MAQLQRSHSSYQGTAWLSMLVATMEKLSGPDHHELLCGEGTFIEVATHLARPMGHPGYPLSRFSLLN